MKKITYIALSLLFITQQTRCPVDLDVSDMDKSAFLLKCDAHESTRRYLQQHHPFIHAALCGADHAQLTKIVHEGARAEDTFYDGSNALHYAARQGHTATLQALIQHFGFALDTQMTDGTTPLMQAAGAGQHTAVSLLLHAKADPDRVDRLGHSFHTIVQGKVRWPISHTPRTFSQSVQQAWHDYRAKNKEAAVHSQAALAAPSTAAAASTQPTPAAAQSAT